MPTRLSALKDRLIAAFDKSLYLSSHSREIAYKAFVLYVYEKNTHTYPTEKPATSTTSPFITVRLSGKDKEETEDFPKCSSQHTNQILPKKLHTPDLHNGKKNLCTSFSPAHDTDFTKSIINTKLFQNALQGWYNYKA
ncbi:hypothetical protein L345_03107, partial [Ophiophagus hannah]